MKKDKGEAPIGEGKGYDLTTISDLYAQGQRRGPAAEVRVRDAYVALFGGNGTQQDADLVLIDLMTTSGYLFTAEAPPGADAASAGALHELNGSRRVGARVAYQLNWPMAKLASIQRAIAAEGIADDEEGLI